MECEQWFCPNHDCDTESWIVEQSRQIADLWSVSSRFGGTVYTIAATDPVCPHCGTTLCMAIDLERRRSERIIEAGPMLDYVRSLR
jgi:hypothetical protein